MMLNAYICAKGQRRDGLADIRVRHEDGQEYQLDLPFGHLYRRCGVPNALALDLLIIAGICYVVDKTIPRMSAANGWTRQLQVDLPTSDPKVWSKLADELSETLTFLTGDEWSLAFHQAEEPLFEPPKKGPLPLSRDFGADAVCLFSGGLDSLSGAIDLLSDAKVGKVFLVGHYDGSGPRKVQADLTSALAEEYPNRFIIEHVRVSHRPAQAVEQSLRSRSLVFIALGLYVAQSMGTKTPLFVFENGFIALNVPLTPSRRSSCSTRTMHPYFLDRLRSIIAALDIPNPIVNPYALKTKGECITECQNLDLLSRLAEISVSCSHSSRRQDWVRKNSRNCGYCVPCICRRAALFKANLDEGCQYGLDILAGELSVDDQLESANDLRAITDFLAYPLSPEAVRKKLIAVAKLPGLDDYTQLVRRGAAEIDGFLNGKSAKVTGQKYA